MRIEIKVGQLYISKQIIGKSCPYVTIRSGLSKIKTKVQEGLQPVYNQTLQLCNDNTTLIVKVKNDTGCFGRTCLPIGNVISSTEIDISRLFIKMETVEAFYSLTNNGAPAGKIYLTITPLSK